MRAECLPTRVKKVYIASWSSGVLASLSHWRSRVRSPSKLPRTQFDMLRFQFLLNAIDKAERRLTTGSLDRQATTIWRLDADG